MFLIDMFNKKTTMPTPEGALPGRADPIPTAETHFVNGRPLKEPARRRPAELTGIVQVESVDRAVADRIGTYLLAAAGSDADGAAVRVEVAYDEARSALKVVVFGDLSRGADLLALLGTLTEAEK